MKKILFLFYITTFAKYILSNHKIGNVKKKRGFYYKIAECVIKSEKASTELKKEIEQNLEIDFKQILFPKNKKLNKNDKDIIKNCRNEVLTKAMRDNDILKEIEKRRAEKKDDL